MKVTATIDDAQIRQALHAYRQLMGNLRPVMEQIGQAYERRVVENFERQSDPEGRRWQRLSATTVLWGISRVKGGFRKGGGLGRPGIRYLQGKKILVEKGYLRDKIHYQASAAQVVIGTGAPSQKYAAVQQFGTIRAGRGRKVRIPARPYLAANEGERLRLAGRDREMILGIIHQALGDAVEGRR